VLSPEAPRGVGRPPVRVDHALAAGGHAHALVGLARNAAPLRDIRATVHGGSKQFQAVGEAGLAPASVLLDPASLQPIRVVSGGGGIRTPEGPNGPLRFSRLISFGSTMRSDAGCATQRATVRVQRPRAHRSQWDDVGVLVVTTRRLETGTRSRFPSLFATASRDISAHWRRREPYHLSR
jgi:hypothetical protein